MEKVYHLRHPQAKDVAPMLKIITKIGLKDIINSITA